MAAWVCAECGYVKFYADNPRALKGVGVDVPGSLARDLRHRATHLLNAYSHAAPQHRSHGLAFAAHAIPYRDDGEQLDRYPFRKGDVAELRPLGVTTQV